MISGSRRGGNATRGALIVVRYADERIVGFEHRAEAERFWRELRHRLRNFALDLHPDTTRLVEFGRNAVRDRAERGAGQPQTFDFLGFTPVCTRSRRGGFLLARHTRRERSRAKLREIKQDLRRRWHQDVAEQGRGWAAVRRGHFA